MKRKSGYMILTVTAALCIGTSLPFLLGSSVLNPERQSVKSEIPYCVTSPTVPAKIAFAGQEVDLLRYDHRERMDRELMSFTYMHSTTMLTIKLAPCTGHELPHSGSAGGRFGKWVKCAFYNGKVFEIIRYAICL